MPRHIGTTKGDFSVVVTFISGEQEYVRAWVSVEEAVEMFRHYTSASIPAQRLGFIKEVLITDNMDCTAMQWLQGKGVVFPDATTLERVRKEQSLEDAADQAEEAEFHKQQADWVERNPGC